MLIFLRTKTSSFFAICQNGDVDRNRIILNSGWGWPSGLEWALD